MRTLTDAIVSESTSTINIEQVLDTLIVVLPVLMTLVVLYTLYKIILIERG